VVDQFERKRDARLWEAARTLDEMGELTARWLEGTVAFCPSQPCDGPDWETIDLVPVLAGFNRSGLVTTGSQPGEEVLEGCGQRAWIDGVCSEAVAESLVVAGLTSELVVLAYRPGSVGESVIPVTISGLMPVTQVGGASSAEIIDGAFEDVHPEGRAALRSAWQVTVIDPRWGRNDLLWDLVTTALADTEYLAHP
jgi:hypothetical protein